MDNIHTEENNHIPQGEHDASSWGSVHLRVGKGDYTFLKNDKIKWDIFVRIMQSLQILKIKQETWNIFLLKEITSSSLHTSHLLWWGSLPPSQHWWNVGENAAGNDQRLGQSQEPPNWNALTQKATNRPQFLLRAVESESEKQRCLRLYSTWEDVWRGWTTLLFIHVCCWSTRVKNMPFGIRNEVLILLLLPPSVIVSKLL